MTNTVTGDAIVALSADLIFAARIRAANPAVVLARNPADLLDKVRELKPRLVVLDMDHRGLDVTSVVTEIKQNSNVQILAYVSHVREDLIEAARAAGAHRVMARGAFTKQMQELLN